MVKLRNITKKNLSFQTKLYMIEKQWKQERRNMSYSSIDVGKVLAEITMKFLINYYDILRSTNSISLSKC
jgi:hypothetical protein